MDKKYLDKFYNEIQHNETLDVASFVLPITVIYNSLIYSIKDILEDYDLTKSEVDVLITLSKNGNQMTPTELYRALLFTSSGIAKVLKKLEVKQLISREESVEDKRSMLVVLEEKGLNIAIECLEKINVHHDNFFKHLDKKEKDDLRKILKKMVYSL
ncbi:MAG: MarR family transcriptional regulator [Aliarcobacter sp.]|nr:MarR family transcriptional regulator [Aliarcobacter sp.]